MSIWWLSACLLTVFLTLVLGSLILLRLMYDNRPKRNTKTINTQPVEFYLRLFLFCSSILICSIGGIVLSVYCYFTGQRSNTNHYTGILFYSVTSRLVGIKCHFIKPLPARGGPYVFVCNHQASLDLLAMAFMWPSSVYVIAKESVKWIPGLGWHLWLANNIFIRRSERASAISSLKTAAERILNEKIGVFLFPEGTRSHLDSTGMLPFKKGAFHLAVEAQVPIVPIVISHYSSHLYSFRQRRFNAGDIYIQALDPIETSQYKMGDDLQPLIDSTHRIMSAALIDLDKLRKQE